MRIPPLAACLLLGACSTTAAVEPIQPPPMTDLTLRNQLVEIGDDLRASVIKRFGEAALAEARQGDFIVAKIYPGMLPPPPPPEAGPDYKYPEPPAILLTRVGGAWYRYQPAGGRARVTADNAAAIDAILANPAMWQEPTWGGMPGCTDTGSARIWLRIGNHAEQVRRGVCGGSPLTERLVFAAVNAG